MSKLSDHQAYDLLGHEIRVVLDTGDSRKDATTSGRLMTRDPVCQALVLAKIEEKNGTIETIEWIPSCSVKSVESISEPTQEINEEIDRYFAEEVGGANESDEDIQKRCLKVVNYLKSHHLDVVENPNGTWIIGQCVRFEAPYHVANLYCDQPIVLKRITKLLEGIQ
ncbi:hypothetical protein L3Y34_014323 [Caenorhabditis briggsae]|uniref:AD domain-containing protein n=1 Tax=Caenorhabditis briggsae TaxID=6238 RepID=A0AAE9IXX2_CAEBR|nr:hypothetical protein L3Y34_014323 [Caenorhabditis briggsae]